MLRNKENALTMKRKRSAVTEKTTRPPIAEGLDQRFNLLDILRSLWRPDQDFWNHFEFGLIDDFDGKGAIYQTINKTEFLGLDSLDETEYEEKCMFHLNTQICEYFTRMKVILTIRTKRNIFWRHSVYSCKQKTKYSCKQRDTPTLKWSWIRVARLDSPVRYQHCFIEWIV